jgi:hypothetical protein
MLIRYNVANYYKCTMYEGHIVLESVLIDNSG